ncbi:MAG: tyrosine-type recombinase/integrase [Lachnospiraceae bacterium]
MNLAQPIKKVKDLEKFKGYYRKIKPNQRNELLIILGLNTALRISDILSLEWNAVYNFEKKEYRNHIIVTEQKTGKVSQIYLNSSVLDILRDYKRCLKQNNKTIEPNTFIFNHSNKNVSITRTQAFRIIKEAAYHCDISGVISCHSLRKTFGYHAWKQGIEPALLVTIFNHSSFDITKRYLGIEQDDKDKIFKKIKL